MKLAFFWTGDFSKNILEELIKYENVEIPLIVSQPDKPVGRKKEILPTAVKKLALEKEIRVEQPNTLKNNKEFFKALKELELDFIVVVAYGKIIPKEILNIPKFWCINIHGSLLPKYRGASPIQEALKNGDTTTGITIMYMSEWMDEGDILAKQELDIDIVDNTESIFHKFHHLAPELLINTLEKIMKGKLWSEKQNASLASYCNKIEKKDGKINFSDSAINIYNKHRAYSIWPGIFTTYKGKKFSIESCFYDPVELDTHGEFEVGEVVEILETEQEKIWIVCGSGILILKEIKLEWKKTMDINSFVNGNKDFLHYKFETC